MNYTSLPPAVESCPLAVGVELKVETSSLCLCSKWHTCLLLTVQYTVHTAYYFLIIVCETRGPQNETKITYSSKKKNEYHEKGQYFLSLISESKTHILYIFITNKVKYFKRLFLEMLMIMAYR